MKIKKKLIALSVLVVLLSGCSKIPEGNYEGSAEGYGGPVSLKATIDKDGRLSNVEITAQSETEGLGTTALDKLVAQSIGSLPKDVDMIAGATLTSAAYLNALNTALYQEKAQLYTVDKDLFKEPEPEPIQGLSDETITEGSGQRKGLVGTELLYVRSKPTVEGERIGELVNGTEVIIIAEATDDSGLIWYQIHYPDESSNGYVSSSYVEIIE